jgi:hypothetical protein
MLLAAESLDIGTCWNGVISLGFNDPEFLAKYRPILKLKENMTPLHAIAIGHKDIHPPMPKRVNDPFFTIVE